MSPTENTEHRSFAGKIIGTVIGPKREWRAYKRRVKALPSPYREAVDGVETYLMHFGPERWEDAASLLDDVAELFETAAADEIPIRDIVGDDPVEFVDALIRNYDKSGYVGRQRQRLVDAIDKAAGDKIDGGNTDGGAAHRGAS
jgi:DNA-binding ferritin-like protein (Dps family)